MGVPALEVARLTVGFGPALALHEFSLTVEAGTVVALVGPSGIAKRSLFEAIAGLVPIVDGSVALAGERLDGAPVPERVRRGVCYVPARRGVFPGLTVAQNVALMLPDPEDAETAYASFPALADRRRVRAGSLSGGEQRLLALARAVSKGARLVMADEPFHGLAPRAVAATAEVLTGLAIQRGKAVMVSDVHATSVALAASHVVRLDRPRGSADQAAS